MTIAEDLHRETGSRRQTPKRATNSAMKGSKTLGDASKGNLKQPSSARGSKTVSVAEVFKKPTFKTISRHSRRRRAPEHELFLDYQDSVSDARNVTVAEGKAKVSKAYAHLSSLVDALEIKDQTFKDSVAADAKELFQPLDEEKVETLRPDYRDGSQIKETVIISKRLAALKTTVEQGKRGLELHWAEWEQVQREILELGIEVLGHEAFPQQALRDGRRYNISQAEMIESDFAKKLEEIEQKAGGISKEFIDRMEASEKEMVLRVTNERKGMLQRLMDVL